jgi:probable rRNA maturation factor
MEISVLIDEEVTGSPAEGWFESVAGAVLAVEGLGEAVEAGIVVTGQERIQELNLVHRGIDEATDVLSFPMGEELADAADDLEMAQFVTPPDGIRHLGEVIISFPQAVVQAEQEGHSARRETAILVVHGILHLLGYDHGEGVPVADQAKMKAREVEILARIEELGE